MANDRHSKALDILRRGGVIRQNNDMFRVQGNSGNWNVTVWEQYVMQFYGMAAVEEAERWLENHN